MKRIFLLFLMSLLFCQNIYAAEVKPYNIKQSDVAAMGAILMDAKTGRVLWEKNAYTQLPMASTTKIMTAILALEKGNMSDNVKVSRRASLAPKVKLYLSAGEEVKLGDLMLALMLESSNDAAVAIAEHISGSVEKFCKEMTQKARELGVYNTDFETPNGLDSDNHHSTAYDMAQITRYALQNQDFRRIIQTKNHSFQSSKRHYNIINKNRFLYEYPGATGVKTGFTGKAGQCFVGSAKHGDMELITVVLASGWGTGGRMQKFTDTKKIINYGFDNYAYKEIAKKEEIAGKINIERSKTDNITSSYADGLILPLNKEERENIFVELDLPQTIRAPITEDQKVGTAKIYINGQLIEVIDILADATADRHDLKTSLEKTIGSWLEIGTNEEVDLVLPEF